MVFSSDGKTLACGNKSKISIWNPETLDIIRTIRGQKGPVTSVAFLPDEEILASSDSNHSRLWDIKTGRFLGSFKGHTRHS